MAYKCSFLDSEIYSAQDVNDIFARITSGGVVFTDTGYAFGDLNSAQSGVVSGGVENNIDACRVVKSGSTYKISKGVCFMNDGSAIIFDDNGQVIKITSGVVNYVYLKRNVTKNTIDIVVSQTAGGTDTIPLAQVTAAGDILDRRKYARAKVELSTSGNIRNFTAVFQQCASYTSEAVTVDMGNGAFTYLVVWNGEVNYNNVSQNREASTKNLIPLTEGEEIRVPIGKSNSDETEFLYVKKNGQKIQIYISKAITGAKYTLKFGVI